MSERKEKKKEMILDVAFELFLEKGYNNTKIIDIANAAGIGKGTGYEYFESKETLLLDLLNTKVRQDFLQFAETAESSLSAREKLEGYLAFELNHMEKYGSNVTDFKGLFSTTDNALTEEIFKAAYDIFRFQFDTVLNIIKKGIESGEFKTMDPYAAATCVISSIGFYLSMLYHEPPCPESLEFQQNFRESTDFSILDVIFNGLLA